jgi:hypothetical protein
MSLKDSAQNVYAGAIYTEDLISWLVWKHGSQKAHLHYGKMLVKLGGFKEEEKLFCFLKTH